MWSQILLIFTAVVTAYLFFKRIPAAFPGIKWLLVISSICTGAAELFSLLTFPLSEIIREYLTISIFVFIMTVLLMTVRIMKPAYARYPYISVFLPVLILIAYPFIQGVLALTTIILQILQTGAIIVLSMLISAHYPQFKRGWMAAGSSVLFIAAFVVFWIVPSFATAEVWMWQPFVILGMIFLSMSFPRIFNDSRI